MRPIGPIRLIGLIVQMRPIGLMRPMRPMSLIGPIFKKEKVRF